MRVSRLRRILTACFTMLGGILWAQPTANFTADTLQGCSPALVVNFQNQSTGNPTSFEWNFGDAANSTSNLPNPTFFYSDPGCYDVTLIVSNALGTDTLTQTCFIEVFPLPEAAFVLDIPQGCAPLTVNFTDQSNGNGGAISSYTWVFSDGTNSNAQNPSFTFLTPDTLNLAITLESNNGNNVTCSSTEVFNDVVIITGRDTVDFVPDVVSACDPPLTINYTNNSVLNNSVNPVFVWDFPGGVLPGGGSTFTGSPAPPVTYNTDGQFSATLTMLTDNGCNDTLTLNNIIGIGGVDASFTSSNQVICIGETVSFQSTSTGGVTTVEWNFGENVGVDATGATASYTYNNVGTFPVTIFANNSTCGDTLVELAYITVNPRPTSSFIIDHDQDCQPGIPFLFTDLSTFAVQWDWDFGDGNGSTAANPTHTYTGFGDFPICLVVTNAFGCTDTFCDTVRIQRPDINFSANPREGCIPMDVQYNATANTPGDPIILWEWTLPGGNIGSGAGTPSPLVTYATEGEWNAILIAETASGCRDTIVRNDFILVGTPPISGFTVDEDTVCVLEGLTFTADSANPDWNYFWDFQYFAPGNFVELDSIANTVYPDTGSFSVGLVVENSGCRDTLIIEDMIFVSPPKANFTLSETALCGLPDTITITDESVGPADIIEWQLNGVLYDNTNNPPPLIITAAGSYQFTQILTNSVTGCSDTVNQIITAGNPIASFTSDVVTGCRPLPVQFTNTSQDFSTSVWFSGQTGSSSTSATDPLIVYPDTGFFTVRLVVSDIFGCRDTLDQTDYIEVIGPYALFEADELAGCPGEPIQFIDTSASFGSTIIGWEWDFGDPASGALNNSTLQNPIHEFTDAGSYDVSLIVNDDEGCADTLTKPSYIQITFPQPGFTVADTSTCAGNDITFQNTSQGFGMTYIWHFGDGDSSIDTAPVHAYSDTGFFDVTLIVTDQNGCSDTLIRPNAIYIEPFIAGFFANDTTKYCPPFQPQFTDTTIGNVVAWNWDFGTGFGFSTLQNPGHTYLEPGQFDVTLIATHEDGCRDTLLKEDYIEVTGPTGDFFIEPYDACVGDTITLTAIAVGAVIGGVDLRDGTAIFDSTLNGILDTVVFQHVYNQPRTYSPTFILNDGTCIVPYEDRDSVRVHPHPDAQIFPIDTAGCSPFTINFADSSILGDTTIAAWQWDFGDGNTDSVANPIHTFIGDTTFTVSLNVQDEFGCLDSAFTDVTVREGAIAAFFAVDNSACAPIGLDFQDSSYNEAPVSWTWIFGDGDTLTGVQNPSHVYDDDGLYTVTLIVTDAFGCSDTATRENYVLLERPEVQVYSDLTLACNPITITFFSDSTTTTRDLLSFEWCLTDLITGAEDCFTTNNPEDSLALTFDDAGEYSMTLTIVDSEGCVDSSGPSPVSIRERVIPDPLEMVNVSVISQTSAQVEWGRYPGDDFVEYAIYRSGPGTPALIATVSDINTLLFVDENPGLDFEAQSYCYQVLVLNTCDEYSLLDETELHCTIDLTTQPGIDAIDLNWSPYVGYTVDTYEIYRVESYDLATHTLIGTVPGNVLTFTDFDTFCEDSSFYRVLAIGSGSAQERSYSDISGNAPIHPDPTLSTHVVRATVEDDAVISLSWLPYQGYRPSQYIIEKSENGATWSVLDTVPLTTLSIIDDQVDVDSRSYYYRVFALDECGDVSVVGRIGKTILLNATLQGGLGPVALNWSAYELWEFDVFTYTIEVLNEATGQFEEVGLVENRARSFTDTELSLPQTDFCYRIRARETAGQGAESVSNVSCITLAPRLFMPNVFTPNNDGDNDRFYITAPNIRNGQIRIYNQWGTQVYESDNLEIGWDGLFKGRPSPEGVYVYTVIVEGFDGTQIEQKGTVTLVR